MEAFGADSEDVSNRWTTTLIFIVNGAVAVVSFVMRSKASWNLFVPHVANRALPAHRQPDSFI